MSAKLDRLDSLNRSWGGGLVYLPIASKLKSPFFKGWTKVTPEESASPEYRHRLEKYGNTGILLGTAGGNFCAIDCDSDESLDEWLRLNPRLRNTTQRRGNRGAVLIIRLEGDVPRSRNFTDGEWKADGTQVVIAGTHPRGVQYSLNGKPPLRLRFEELVFPAGWTMNGNACDSRKRPSARKSSPLDFADVKWRPSFRPAKSPHDVVKISAEFVKRFGEKAEAIYAELVHPHVDKLRESQRNSTLTHVVVPTLISRCGIEAVLLQTEQMYCRKAGLFNDSLDRHQREAMHVANAIRSRFPDALTPQEAECYEMLSRPHERDTFRIIHGLAYYSDDESPPPPEFFLSSNSLATRLGMAVGSDMLCHRILARFCSAGILTKVSTGTRFKAGSQARATVWRYLLGPDGVEEDRPDE